ncbi:hypothetical protein [Pacificoceanicola onchidii]|uniref:hypothetical protein n=1 Tax=Pacificoceanicola onchidii TaxID=2562685 RepID=UPI0010A6911A|nr:hypothetical protein [Pacificoceanicola onchidii]
MFLELITVFVAGFAGAGMTMLLNKTSGGRLPKWVIPVGAGAAMILATISLEYSWYDRTRAALPDGTKVLSTDAGGAAWRPWTYMVPMVDRFWSVDPGSMLTNQDNPERHIARVVRHGRWAKPEARVVAVDCAQQVWAEGQGDAPSWQEDSDVFPIVATVCAEG